MLTNFLAVWGGWLATNTPPMFYSPHEQILTEDTTAYMEMVQAIFPTSSLSPSTIHQAKHSDDLRLGGFTPRIRYGCMEYTKTDFPVVGESELINLCF